MSANPCTSSVALVQLAVFEGSQGFPVQHQWQDMETAKFFVLEPPMALQQIMGNYMPCEYHGHMYSFEVMYTDFLQTSPQLLASSAEEADFVVVPHCITYVYHVLRWGKGFNTVALTWEALRLVQEDYLLPIINWAKSTPAYRRFDGRNFVLVLALDKGRVDYPFVSEATSNWHAITTVGNGTWMQTVRPWLHDKPRFADEEDVCHNQTSTSKRRLVYYDQDIVVPVPTAFYWSDFSASISHRNLTVFYSGTSNSCIRKYIVSSLSGSSARDVYVATQPLPREDFSGFLHRSRFCLVPDGFSSISARLYEALVHGCVPVIFGESFHPPFDSLLNWRNLAVFLRPTDVPRAPEILRSISESRYMEMHSEVARAHTLLNVDSMGFWAAVNFELKRRSWSYSSRG